MWAQARPDGLPMAPVPQRPRVGACAGSPTRSLLWPGALPADADASHSDPRPFLPCHPSCRAYDATTRTCWLFVIDWGPVQVLPPGSGVTLGVYVPTALGDLGDSARVCGDLLSCTLLDAVALTAPQQSVHRMLRGTDCCLWCFVDDQCAAW